MWTVETTAGFSDLYPGDYTYEVQAIVLAADSALTSALQFQLTLDGVTTTGYLDATSSAVAVRTALDALLLRTSAVTSYTTVAVQRTSSDPTGATGATWLVTFTHFHDERVQGAGNIALARCVLNPTTLTAATVPTCSVSQVRSAGHDFPSACWWFVLYW